jgi:hypothetical protein
MRELERYGIFLTICYHTSVHIALLFRDACCQNWISAWLHNNTSWPGNDGGFSSLANVSLRHPSRQKRHSHLRLVDNYKMMLHNFCSSSIVCFPVTVDKFFPLPL